MSDCSFCRIVAHEPEAHVLATEHALGFLDILPTFPGHVLVVPRRHHVLFTDVPTDELASLMSAVQLAMRAVSRATGCDGHLLANNNVVMQTVPHLHWHVIPRTRGDDLGAAMASRVPYGEDELQAWRARLRGGRDRRADRRAGEPGYRGMNAPARCRGVARDRAEARTARGHP